MPNSEVYWGYGILFAAIIAGRFISESALRKLDATQKAAVLDEFAGLRRYNLVVLAGLVFLALSYLESALVTFPAYLIVAAGLTFTKLRRLDVPASYARAQLASTGLSLFGLVGCFTMWFWPTLAAR